MLKLCSVFGQAHRLLCLQVPITPLRGRCRGYSVDAVHPATRQLCRPVVFWVILTVKRTNFQHQENQLLTVWAPEQSSVGMPPVRD